MSVITMKAIPPVMDNEHTLINITYTVKVSDDIMLYTIDTSDTTSAYNHDFNTHPVILVQIIYNIKNTTTGVIEKQYSDIDVITKNNVCSNIVSTPPKIEVDTKAYTVDVSVSEPKFIRGVSVLRSVDVFLEDILGNIIDKRIGIYNIKNIEFQRPDNDTINIRAKYNFDNTVSAQDGLKTVILHPATSSKIMVNKRFINKSGDALTVVGIDETESYRLFNSQGETVATGTTQNGEVITTPATDLPLHLYIASRTFKLELRG